ncbi:protein-export chaperone SecB [Alteromonas gilva]|uniref:Protein-export chaperone SecB n=1 Tax=Alteromonas gilva TaxID=2987522 RepID=A0ABT5L5Y2_9ALTE|nr:protein-export chaperone SecB [Alteromonas gilva]MDC8832467.1 protein-export chaperone SecB [Alteromonas gilva]
MQATSGDKSYILKKIFMKDVACEAPKGAEAMLMPKGPPAVSVDVGGKSERVRDNLWEVELSLNITLQINQTPVFAVEIYQAGLFECEGLSEAELHRVLNTDCMETLFPYARETIDSLIVKAGFPAISLQPVNFHGLYAQAMAEQAK